MEKRTQVQSALDHGLKDKISSPSDAKQPMLPSKYGSCDVVQAEVEETNIQTSQTRICYMKIKYCVVLFIFPTVTRNKLQNALRKALFNCSVKKSNA